MLCLLEQIGTPVPALINARTCTNTTDARTNHGRQDKNPPELRKWEGRVESHTTPNGTSARSGLFHAADFRATLQLPATPTAIFSKVADQPIWPGSRQK
jgi:hypothetical protein